MEIKKDETLCVQCGWCLAYTENINAYLSGDPIQVDDVENVREAVNQCPGEALTLW
jgi:ferredoxin